MCHEQALVSAIVVISIWKAIGWIDWLAYMYKSAAAAAAVAGGGGGNGTTILGSHAEWYVGQVYAFVRASGN